MGNILRAEGFLLALIVPQALAGECGGICSTICAAVLQREGAKIVWIQCFGFTGFVGQSNSFLLLKTLLLIRVLLGF